MAVCQYPAFGVKTPCRFITSQHTSRTRCRNTVRQATTELELQSEPRDLFYTWRARGDIAAVKRCRCRLWGTDAAFARIEIRGHDAWRTAASRIAHRHMISCDEWMGINQGRAKVRLQCVYDLVDSAATY